MYKMEYKNAIVHIEDNYAGASKISINKIVNMNFKWPRHPLVIQYVHRCYISVQFCASVSFDYLLQLTQIDPSPSNI